jgi:hypothetical protein
VPEVKAALETFINFREIAAVLGMKSYGDGSSKASVWETDPMFRGMLSSDTVLDGWFQAQRLVVRSLSEAVWHTARGSADTR